MVRKIDFFHGAILFKLLRKQTVQIKKLDNSSAYLFNDKVIYLKFSSQRITPWSFTLTKENIDEIEELNNKYCGLTLMLLCNDDGLAILRYDEYRTIISINNDTFPKWIKAVRYKREKYTITGSDGSLSYKIGENRIKDFSENRGLISDN